MRLRETLKAWIPARKIARWLRARTSGYPRWDRILGEANRPKLGPNSSTGPRILMATSVGAYLPGAGLESLIGAALLVRGADVDALLCDRVLPACSDCLISWYPEVRRFVERGPQADLCGSCFQPAKKMYERLGIPVHNYGAFVDEGERA